MIYFKPASEKDIKQKEYADKGFQDLEILNSFGSEVSVEIFKKCLANPYQFIRIEAINKVSGYCRKDFIYIFAIALNDRCEYVIEESAKALTKINTNEALEILSAAFFEDVNERPHYLANAISQFGERGFEVLLSGTKSVSPNIRYFSAKFLGSTGIEAAMNILENIANNDNQETSFAALVSSGAKKGIKTLSRILSEKS